MRPEKRESRHKPVHYPSWLRTYKQYGYISFTVGNEASNVGMRTLEYGYWQEITEDEALKISRVPQRPARPQRYFVMSEAGKQAQALHEEEKREIDQEHTDALHRYHEEARGKAEELQAEVVELLRQKGCEFKDGHPLVPNTDVQFNPTTGKLLCDTWDVGDCEYCGCDDAMRDFYDQYR